MGKCIIEVPTDIMMKMRWSPVLLINDLWYFVRNRRWTITINSHLANCSTRNAFSAPVNAIFHKLPSSGKIYKLHFVNNYEWSWKYTLSADTSVFDMSAMVTVLQACETPEGLLTCPVFIQSHPNTTRGNRQLSLAALPRWPAASQGIKLPLLPNTRSDFQ